MEPIIYCHVEKKEALSYCQYLYIHTGQLKSFDYKTLTPCSKKKTFLFTEKSGWTCMKELYLTTVQFLWFEQFRCFVTISQPQNLSPLE